MEAELPIPRDLPDRRLQQLVEMAFGGALDPCPSRSDTEQRQVLSQIHYYKNRRVSGKRYSRQNVDVYFSKG
jgi:hypothetical protein